MAEKTKEVKQESEFMEAMVHGVHTVIKHQQQSLPQLNLRIITKLPYPEPNAVKPQQQRV